jgi:hypothetical protein
MAGRNIMKNTSMFLITLYAFGSCSSLISMDLANKDIQSSAHETQRTAKYCIKIGLFYMAHGETDLACHNFAKAYTRGTPEEKEQAQECMHRLLKSIDPEIAERLALKAAANTPVPKEAISTDVEQESLPVSPCPLQLQKKQPPIRKQ